MNETTIWNAVSGTSDVFFDGISKKLQENNRNYPNASKYTESSEDFMFFSLSRTDSELCGQEPNPSFKLSTRMSTLLRIFDAERQLRVKGRHAGIGLGASRTCCN